MDYRGGQHLSNLRVKSEFPSPLSLFPYPYFPFLNPHFPPILWLFIPDPISSSIHPFFLESLGCFPFQSHCGIRTQTWSQLLGFKIHLCHLVAMSSYLSSATRLGQSSLPQFPQLQNKDANKSLYHVEFLGDSHELI